MPTAALVLYVAALSAYSVVPGGTPGTAVTELLPGRDLTAHSLASGGLAFLLSCVLAAYGIGILVAAGVASVVALAYAAGVEVLQAALPWRTASLTDLVASIPGILLACAVWIAWRKLSPGAAGGPLRAKADAAAERRT